MSQPRWSDRQSASAYDDEPGRYGLPRDPSYDDYYVQERTRGGSSASDSISPRWGRLPGRFGVFVVIGSAALGAFVCAATNRAPGVVLGVFLVAGTAVAALTVRPSRGYLIFPVPAIAYLGAALIAGLVYDRGDDSSRTVLAVNGTQWIANGFVAMCVATAVAVVIITARWLRNRRFS